MGEEPRRPGQGRRDSTRACLAARGPGTHARTWPLPLSAHLPPPPFGESSSAPPLTGASIDGVLYQGQRAIPGAAEALRKIHSLGIRYVFLTNGGGAHEDAKAASLARRLHMPRDDEVIRDRVIVSHTPMRSWPDAVKEQTVLITASHPETARQLANE